MADTTHVVELAKHYGGLAAVVAIVLVVLVVARRRKMRKRAASVAINQAWIFVGSRYLVFDVQAGQTEVMWDRPDGTKTCFPLREEWRQNVGDRGSVWMFNGANGDLYKPSLAEDDSVVELTPKDLTVVDVDGNKLPDAKVVFAPELKDIVFRPAFEVRTVAPSADYYRTVIDDKREQKWFRALSAEENKQNMKKIIMIAVGALVVFLIVKNGGFGGKKESVIQLQFLGQSARQLVGAWFG